MKWILTVLTVVICLLPLVVATHDQPYHLKLLAVQESGGHYEGSDADLFLEVKDGSGRVFLDTYPVTKMDTQISTRFAKEIACNHYNLDCSDSDFIFTIKADSNIIGGPSAGAAIAALTSIALLDLEYNNDVAVTGTINSGGVVGPVGGVKEKIEAAAQSGIHKVLVSKGTANMTIFNNETNQSDQLDLVEYGRVNLSVEVVEVTTLDEVIFHLTGYEVVNQNSSISKSAAYNDIMRGLQEGLCTRMQGLRSQLKEETLPANFSSRVNERIERVIAATEQQDYYSAASYCFGINIDVAEQVILQQNLSDEQIEQQWQILRTNVTALQQKLDSQEIDTISDLQTLMIVEERIHDVQTIAAKPHANRADSIRSLAYALERFYSAVSWMDFFSMPGKKLALESERIKLSCFEKLSEAEERVQYTELFLSPGLLTGIHEKIREAKNAANEDNFSLCLSTASQAKADSNAILTSIGVDDATIVEIINSKRSAVEKTISQNTANDIWPILGYSYYEYANSLQDQERYTALVYMEYALEMSDLSIYFPTDDRKPIELVARTKRNNRNILLVGEGFLIGTLAMSLIFMALQYRSYRRRNEHKFKPHYKKF